MMLKFEIDPGFSVQSPEASTSFFPAYEFFDIPRLCGFSGRTALVPIGLE